MNRTNDERKEAAVRSKNGSIMPDASTPDDSEQEEPRLHVTSDPDRTETEQPHTSGARGVSGLPFRILLVSDLVRGASPEDWSAGDHVHRVDANRFADIMAEMAPRLSLEVRNTLGDTPQTWDLELSFPDLEAFEPESLAQQVEPTAQLLDVRDLVEKVGDGSIDLDTFRARLDEMGVDMDWAEDLYQTLAGEDEPLDRLIGMVDVDEEDELEICKRIRAYRSRPSDPLGSAVACQVGHKRDRSAISGSKRKSTPGTQGHDGFLGASRLFMCPIWARGGWS
jgi:type VI secretion system ImpB/VipA family protein